MAKIGEWLFKGTAQNFGQVTQTFSETRSDIFLRVSPKINGSVRVDFKSSEPYCHGWAVTEPRPDGDTLITVSALKDWQWEHLEPIWRLLVDELDRKGWDIEKYEKDKPLWLIEITPGEYLDTRILRDTLSRRFSETGLNELCMDLGLDYEDLSGNSKRDRAVALVKKCDRRKKLKELAQYIQKRRPDISLTDIGLQVQEGN